MKSKELTPEDNLDILEMNLRTISEALVQLRGAYHNARAAEVRTPLQIAYAVRADLRHLSREVEASLTALRYQIDEGRFGE